MLNSIKTYIKKTPFIIPFILVKHAISKKLYSQSNEAEIIDRLVGRFDIPKTFVEFGFSGWEFNCCEIAHTWDGLLIDGDGYNVTVAKRIFQKNIIAKKMWLTLDALDYVLDHCASKNLGILSIDVDGNDYWFLEKLIVTKPAVVVIEFNVSFGLRPISVPYDPAFDRNLKHESGEYYGASIFSMHYICNLNGYSLIEVSRNGVNGFFVRNDLLGNDDRRLTVAEAHKEKRYPDGSIAPTSRFWESVKHMPYVDVTQPNTSHISKGERFYV